MSPGEAAPAEDPAMAGLVLRAQRGDRDAFAELYARFASTVHGLIVANGPWQQADDLTQETFLRVYERLGSLRDPAAFPSFLCAAARNTATSALRRRRHEGTATGLPELAASDPGPMADLAAREAVAAVLQCIRSLPQTYRETLTLRLVEGLGGAEIAARTGMTHGSVRVNLTRGMAQLRTLLVQEGLSS